MPTDNVTIRPALPSEAQLLSGIAMRSKAHWGYEQELLDHWADDLTVHPDHCDGESTWVLEVDGSIVGFGEILVTGSEALLDDLWIAPEHIGCGFGKQLFAFFRDKAIRRGAKQLLIEADPHAASFYEHMGARNVGETLSTTVPGRSLPKMILDLTAVENTTINPE